MGMVYLKSPFAGSQLEFQVSIWTQRRMRTMRPWVPLALATECTTLHEECPMQLDARELINLMQVAPKIQAQGEHDISNPGRTIRNLL
jgi:hypothetical protein